MYELNFREGANKAILDRERTVEDVKKLTEWLTLLQDVVDYGTHLIPRGFVSSDRKFKDIIVIGTLLRQVVGMLDAVELLMSNGAVQQAHIAMRALFEAAIYLEWVLKSDSENKVRYYYFQNLKRQRLWALRTVPGTAESKEFATARAGRTVPISDEVLEGAKKRLVEINAQLAKPEYTKIEAEFKALKRRGPWYLPLGPKNLRQLSREVGKEEYYLVFYALGSEVMHSANYEQHVKFQGDKVTFEPIRYMQGFGEVLNVSIGMALEAFRATLTEYGPSELANFSKKYMEKWRGTFMNFPKITYNVETAWI